MAAYDKLAKFRRDDQEDGGNREALYLARARLPEPERAAISRIEHRIGRKALKRAGIVLVSELEKPDCRARLTIFLTKLLEQPPAHLVRHSTVLENDLRLIGEGLARWALAGDMGAPSYSRRAVESDGERSSRRGPSRGRVGEGAGGVGGQGAKGKADAKAPKDGGGGVKGLNPPPTSLPARAGSLSLSHRPWSSPRGPASASMGEMIGTLPKESPPSFGTSARSVPSIPKRSGSCPSPVRVPRLPPPRFGPVEAKARIRQASHGPRAVPEVSPIPRPLSHAVGQPRPAPAFVIPKRPPGACSKASFPKPAGPASAKPERR